MDGSVVGSSSSERNISDSTGDDTDFGVVPFRKGTLSYTGQFQKACPIFLAMGMTYDQFWYGDPVIARMYLKADRIRRDRANEQLWLQGMYIYEAMCDVAPIFNTFAKRGTKPHPYAERPYPLNAEQREEVERDHDRKIAAKGKALFAKLMGMKPNDKQ